MKISEIAMQLDYDFYGTDVDVISIKYAHAANSNEIAIIRKASEVDITVAQCVLSQPAMIKTDKTILYSSDPIEFAAVKIAHILIGERRENGKNTNYSMVDNYYIGENVYIGKNSYIAPNAYIDNNVSIGDNCYIAPNVHIGSGTQIRNGVRIGTGSMIGADSFYHYYDKGLKEFAGLGKVVIGEDVTVGNNTTIQVGTFSDTIIGARCKIGNLIDIGHDVCVGQDCKIVSQTGIASDVVIGDSVTIFGQVGIANGVTIGNNAIVYAKSLVTKSIMDGKRVSGIYARDHAEEVKTQAKIRRL